MTDTYSKSRQQAEVAFGKIQTEFFARGHALDALDTIAQARDEKTKRLREARKAKEFADRASAASVGAEHGRKCS
jgi:hypothetical protein